MAENYVVTQATPQLVAEYFPNCPEVVRSLPLPFSREQLEAALASIPGISSERRDSDHTFLESDGGMYSEICFIGMSDSDAPSFGFWGGHIELIDDILSRLSSEIGPLLLFFGSGDDPRLFPNTEAEQGGGGQAATRSEST